jgi:hypothetical protein
VNNAGYSGKPLVAKLGYKPGDQVYEFGMPHDISHYLHGEKVELVLRLPATWAHGFFNWQSELEFFLSSTELNQIEKGLWVSWPKKTSGIETDLTEQMFRDLILPLGWVDTKVAAVNETWSGLLFYRRKV